MAGELCAERAALQGAHILQLRCRMSAVSKFACAISLALSIQGAVVKWPATIDEIPEGNKTPVSTVTDLVNSVLAPALMSGMQVEEFRFARLESQQRIDLIATIDGSGRGLYRLRAGKWDGRRGRPDGRVRHRITQPGSAARSFSVCLAAPRRSVGNPAPENASFRVLAVPRHRWAVASPLQSWSAPEVPKRLASTCGGCRLR